MTHLISTSCWSRKLMACPAGFIAGPGQTCPLVPISLGLRLLPSEKPQILDWKLKSNSDAMTPMHAVMDHSQRQCDTPGSLGNLGRYLCWLFLLSKEAIDPKSVELDTIESERCSTKHPLKSRVLWLSFAHEP